MATTPLHMAARDGNVERVQEILEGRNGQVKVSINTQNAIGQTPIHLAAKWGRLNVIKFLIEEGADLEITDRKGRTPLHEADDSIVQTHLLRHSQKLRMTMDVSKMSMANATFELKQQRRIGDITDG
jgi:ankyrin